MIPHLRAVHPCHAVFLAAAAILKVVKRKVKWIQSRLLLKKLSLVDIAETFQLSVKRWRPLKPHKTEAEKGGNQHTRLG